MSQYLASSKTGTQRSVYPGLGLALPTKPYVPTTGTAYTRPADWLTIPSLTPGVDKKIYLLAAIYNDTSNQFALYAAGTGAGYTVDWGDGLGTVNYASGVTASYNIAWSNISSGTLTTRGYRQALITVTAQAGATITNFSLNAKNSSNTTLGIPANNWLEVAMCNSDITTISFTLANAYLTMIEKINFVQTGTIASMASVFNNCSSLQSVNAPTIASNASLDSTFKNCYSLRTAPTLSAVTTPSTMVNMFSGCYSLVDPGTFDHMNSGAGCSTGSMFDGCVSLQTAPAFGPNFKSSTPNTMYRNCYSLRNAPPLDLTHASVASLDNMYQACFSLKTAPFLKLPPAAGAGVYSALFMFNNCYNLTTIPAYDWSGCTSFSNTFAGCQALENTPPINAPYCTTMTSMFNACRALRSVGNITSGSVLTDVSSMFLNCQYLEAGPTISNMTGVTTINSMYSGCNNLRSVPDMTLGNVTTMASAFATCTSLKTAPNVTMNSSSTLSSTLSMFQNCYTLNSVPNFTTFSWAAAGTTAQTMFSGCQSLPLAPTINGIENVITLTNMYASCTILREVPAYNLNKATSTASMFLSCPTLQQAPAFTNTGNITTVNAMFSGCATLENIPAYNLTGVSSAANATSFVLNCGNLARSQVSNIRFSHSYINCKLSGTQLDEIYTNLPTITAQTITVSNNWGTATDTPTIATAKGWTVTG